jgi:hypothetical protein
MGIRKVTVIVCDGCGCEAPVDDMTYVVAVLHAKEMGYLVEGRRGPNLKIYCNETCKRISKEGPITCL